MNMFKPEHTQKCNSSRYKEVIDEAEKIGVQEKSNGRIIRLES